MAEKVIFEFRVKRDEDGCGFEVRRGEGRLGVFGPDIGACCPPGGFPGMPQPGPPPGFPPGKDRLRNNMRETLDFFERIYDDLFGEEESDENVQPD